MLSADDWYGGIESLFGNKLKMRDINVAGKLLHKRYFCIQRNNLGKRTPRVWVYQISDMVPQFDQSTS